MALGIVGLVIAPRPVLVLRISSPASRLMAMSPPPLTGKPRFLAPWQEGVAVYLSSDSQPQGIHISISAVLFITGSPRIVCVSLSTFVVPSMSPPRRALVRIPSDRITLLTNFLRTGVFDDCWSRISILLVVLTQISVRRGLKLSYYWSAWLNLLCGT